MIRRTTTNNKLILNIDMRGLLRCDIVHPTAPPSPKWSHKCTRRRNTQMTFNSKWEMTLKISGKSSFYENKDSQENRSKILMNISPHILTFCGFNRSSAAHKLWYSIFFFNRLRAVSCKLHIQNAAQFSSHSSFHMLRLKPDTWILNSFIRQIGYFQILRQRRRWWLLEHLSQSEKTEQCFMWVQLRITQ